MFFFLVHFNSNKQLKLDYDIAKKYPNSCLSNAAGGVVDVILTLPLENGTLSRPLRIFFNPVFRNEL